MGVSSTHFVPLISILAPKNNGRINLMDLSLKLSLKLYSQLSLKLSTKLSKTYLEVCSKVNNIIIKKISKNYRQ